MAVADDIRFADVVALDSRPLFNPVSAHLSALLADAWQPGGADLALSDVDRRLAARDRWYGGKSTFERRQILAAVLLDLGTIWALVSYADGETDEMVVLSYTVLGVPAGIIRIGRCPVVVPEDLSGIRIGFPPEREEC